MATPPVKHRNGLIGTVVFHLSLLMLLFFMAFRTPLPLPEEQGIMVDFGNTDLGLGNFEPRLSDPARVQPQTATSTTTQPQENLTQDIEETAALPEKSVTKPAAEISPRETQTQTQSPSAEQSKPVEQERTVDPRSLFPGRGDASSTATSQGEAGGQGNQGSPTGAPNVHVYGEGIDIGGGLADRGIVGGLPRPVYNVQEHGVVVVSITVDRNGNVTNATAGARGTTTLNETLRNAAVRAAMQTKFSPNPNRIEQTGTITYTFKLKGE